MADKKPKIRVPAGRAMTTDSFINVEQRLGLGSGGQLDGSGYAMSNLTRMRQTLENAYRTSWIVGTAVDAPAEDMTRAGITLATSLPPGDEKLIMDAYRDLQIGEKLTEGEKWGRLYGGAINLMMIDGQDLSTPLNLNAIKQGQFKGLLPLDRWIAYADVTRTVSELGPDIGLPEFYTVMANPQMGLSQMRIHHTRVVRHVGNLLPIYQRVIEQSWGESILERIWDRILAFDSTTMGAAQLVFKAHLRTLKLDKYRELIAAGGKMYEAVIGQLQHIRHFQNIEGLTVIDGTDEFETHTYNFAGLDDVLQSFSEQVCGAVKVPHVRFFGDSPGGLNSDGDSALKTYYDQIAKDQESKLRRPTTRILDVLARSTLGRSTPPDFGFSFNPLWQMSAKEKAEIAKATTESVVSAYGANVITQKVAMQELKASAATTGIFSNISDDDIEAAEDTIPDPVEMAGALAEATTPLGEPEPGKTPKSEKAPADE